MFAILKERNLCLYEKTQGKKMVAVPLENAKTDVGKEGIPFHQKTAADPISANPCMLIHKRSFGKNSHR